MEKELIEKINKITLQDLIYKKDFEKMQHEINTYFEKGLISFSEFLEITTYNKKMMENVDNNKFLIR